MGCGCSSKPSRVVHPCGTRQTTTSVVPVPVPETSEQGTRLPNRNAPSEAMLAWTSSDGKSSAVSSTAPASEAKTTLIKAAKEGDVTTVDQLLRSGEALETLGMWDNTPLLVACTYNKPEIALRLITARANIHAKNEQNTTPLHYAAVEGMLSVVQALLAAEGNEGAQKLLNCPPANFYNRHLDSYAHRTPLTSAAECGFSEVCSVLVSAGADIESTSHDGKTALWLSARFARVHVVKLLLQHRANAAAKDAAGVSVLEAATVVCNDIVILALLAYGVADVNDTSGFPLHAAVKAGNRAVVEALLTQGAAVHPKGDDTGAHLALHAACQKGDEYIVALLMRSRADPGLKDPAGFTAFDLLRRRGFADQTIVELLRMPDLVDDAGTGGIATINRGAED